MVGGHADERYYFDDYPQDVRDREPRHHRRHRSHREYDQDEEDYIAARRERRERRQAEEARRGAEEDFDLHDSRARRESHYSRPEPERRRESHRMAHDMRTERDAKPRSSRREVRGEGTVRRKRREVVHDDRSDDYVYGRPTSGGVIEEVTVRRSAARRRSDEGGSSSRTLHSPLSGSRTVSREEIPKLSRSKSAKEPTRVYMTRPSVRRNSAQKPPLVSAAPSARTRSASVRELPARRNPGILATLFAPAPRPNTAILQKEVVRVPCVACMEELPSTKTARLGCGHRMCHSCVKRQFVLSVKDPLHMPPRCCTTDHIPLRYVERLFDDKFKRIWNRKYQEYTTANRLYCPNKGCGEWIKPSKIKTEYGRKYAKCGRCSTKVCALCNGKFHTRRECPKDPETKRIVQMAKDRGWQSCYHCNALVELKEGCNHMTCRCGAQFCMVCAKPWKTCNCPWFDYQLVEDDDRLNDMRIPEQNVIEVIEEPESPYESAPPPVRHTSTRIRHRTDRDLDRADESLAAHLQAQLRLDGASTPSDMRPANPAVQVYGLGNSGAHHMNESYTVRPLANTSARAAARMSAPSIFGRRLSVREPPRVSARAAAPAVTVSTVRASAMAGLSLDGSKRGANRVGTWLNHVSVDHEAIHTAPRGVEVDDWRVEGSMVGID